MFWLSRRWYQMSYSFHNNHKTYRLERVPLTFGWRREFMLENGSVQQSQHILSENLWRTMMSILTSLTRSTGTSFPLPILMVMPTLSLLTECGGKQEALRMATMDTALVLILIETGIFIGEERISASQTHVNKLFL